MGFSSAFCICKLFYFLELKWDLAICWQNRLHMHRVTVLSVPLQYKHIQFLFLTVCHTGAQTINHYTGPEAVTMSWDRWLKRIKTRGFLRQNQFPDFLNIFKFILCGINKIIYFSIPWNFPYIFAKKWNYKFERKFCDIVVSTNKRSQAEVSTVYSH